MALDTLMHGNTPTSAAATLLKDAAGDAAACPSNNGAAMPPAALPTPPSFGFPACAVPVVVPVAELHAAAEGIPATLEQAFSPHTVRGWVEQSGLRHVGIIMDGNRRWAKQRSLPSTVGHWQGVESLKRLVRYADTIGLPVLTLYAFSTENWRRHPAEVAFLMKLFVQVLTRELAELNEQGVQIRVLGDLEPLPAAVKTTLENACRATTSNRGVVMQLAVNYGGQQEIVAAVRQLLQALGPDRVSPDAITVERLNAQIGAADLPAVDLIIRPGGETRLSNFLLWQAAYAELYWSPVLWPDFDEVCFAEAVEAFVHRQRRFGG